MGALSVAILVGLLLWYIPENREIEIRWRGFADCISKKDFTHAFEYMGESYRRDHNLEDFKKGPWCETNNMVNCCAERAAVQLVYVTRLPFSHHARVVISSNHLTMPLCFEDGFVAVVTRMENEDGSWRIADFVSTVMR